MYSYEDRLRAVRLYIKLGRRVGLTIRQLGYPTKNALTQRHGPAALPPPMLWPLRPTREASQPG